MTELMKRYEAETGDLHPRTRCTIDLLEWYQRFSAWLESQLTWRPVSEGLPEKQGDFFVRTPRSFPKNIPYQVAEFYDDNNTFYEEHTDSPLDDVTHWLPIPPAPEGE